MPGRTLSIYILSVFRNWENPIKSSKCFDSYTIILLHLRTSLFRRITALLVWAVLVLWTGNLAIPSWCYYPLWYCYTVMLFCFLVYENICSSRWEYGRFFRLFIAILYYVYSDIWIPVSEAQRDTLQNLWVGAVLWHCNYLFVLS